MARIAIAVAWLFAAGPAAAQTPAPAIPTLALLPACGGPIQIAPPPSKRPPPVRVDLADGRSCMIQCPAPEEPSGPPGEIVIADVSRTQANGSVFSTRLTYDAGVRAYDFRQAMTTNHQPTREVGTHIGCQPAAGH